MKDELREKLTAYALGDLPESEAAELRAEIDASPAGQAELKEVEATLGILNEALSADAGAPSTLTPDQLRELRAVLPRSRPAQIIHWFTVAHPELTKAAASLILCGLIVVVLIPRYTLSRSAESGAIDESGVRVNREATAAFDQSERKGAVHVLSDDDADGLPDDGEVAVGGAVPFGGPHDPDIAPVEAMADVSTVNAAEVQVLDEVVLSRPGLGRAAPSHALSINSLQRFDRREDRPEKKAQPEADAAARARELVWEDMGADAGSDSYASTPKPTSRTRAGKMGEIAEKETTRQTGLVSKGGPQPITEMSREGGATLSLRTEHRANTPHPPVVMAPAETPLEESIPAPSVAPPPTPTAPKRAPAAKTSGLGDIPLIGRLFNRGPKKQSNDSAVMVDDVRKKRKSPASPDEPGQSGPVAYAASFAYAEANDNAMVTKQDGAGTAAQGWQGAPTDAPEVKSEAPARWYADATAVPGSVRERRVTSGRGGRANIDGTTVSDDVSDDTFTVFATGERAFRSTLRVQDEGRKNAKTAMRIAGKDATRALETTEVLKGGTFDEVVAVEGEEDELELVDMFGAESDVGSARGAGLSTQARDSDEGGLPVSEVSDEKLRVVNGSVVELEGLATGGEIAVRRYDLNGVALDELAKRADARKPKVARTSDFVSGFDDKVAGNSEADLEEVFQRLGIETSAGSSVTYDANRGQLIVANTPQELDRVANEIDRAVTELEARVDPTVFKAHGVNPVLVTKHQPVSTFSIDVDTASYTLTRRYMQGGTLPPAEAVRTEEFVNFFDYDYAAPLSRTFGVYAEVAPSEFGQGMHVLKLGVKGKRLGREEQRPAVLTLVIDTSGSMNTPDRLGLARTSLRMLIDRLAPTDQVAIVQYGSSARLLLDHTPASEKKTILSVLERMQTSGSTNLDEGLRLGYEVAARSFVSKGENRVILMSDGVANVGPVEADEMLRNVATHRKQGIKCSVFGFGVGSYNDANLERLADSGDGVYAFVDSIDEAKRLFVDDLSATLNTIASDVKIQVEFNPKRVRTYRQLGYENRQLTEKQFRDDTVDAGEVGSGQSVTALYELTLEDARREAIGVARVRFRNTDTGFVEELTLPIRAQRIPDTFAQASPRFRLATCVAEFAEILRGSPYADGGDVSEVARVLRGVRGELKLDRRVEELTRLVSAAEGMPRAHK